MGKSIKVSGDDFSNFLYRISNNPLHVIDPNIPHSKYSKLDLSVNNRSLQSLDVANANELGGYVDQVIESSNASVAYGGYLEHRAIYDRSDYFNSESADETRNIHLGVDLWLSEGSKIYATLDGKVHSFKNNMNFGDYGPTIILEHLINDWTFFTLYGHLSLDSLENLVVGQEINKGEEIARLGSVEVNGNYPPHLHFQVIQDLQGNYGDYPGVSNQLNLDFYKKNCPDPNLLLKIES